MRGLLNPLTAVSLAALCSCASGDDSGNQSADSALQAGTGGSPVTPARAGVTNVDDSGGASTEAQAQAPRSTSDGAGAPPSTADSEAPPDAVGLVGQAPDPSSAGDATDTTAAPPAVSVVCPPGPFAASPLLEGATPQPVCTGMTFTEGAVWFAERGTLFFSDFQIGGAATNFNGRIMTFTPGGQCEEFLADTGTNGLAIAPDGNLLGCSHSARNVQLFDLTTKQATVLIPATAAGGLNAPNDVAVRSDGNMYITDPTFLLAGRMGQGPRTYRRAPNGELTVIDTGNNPNGIMLSPDEKLLYLSHMNGPSNITVFDVDDAGAVNNPRVFVDNVGSDGMAMDCAGNLYITQGGGVSVYSPQAELLGIISAPGAANVAFGGPERKTLFITARTSLLQVDLAIPGFPY